MIAPRRTLRDPDPMPTGRKRKAPLTHSFANDGSIPNNPVFPLVGPPLTDPVAGPQGPLMTLWRA